MTQNPETPGGEEITTEDVAREVESRLEAISVELSLFMGTDSTPTSTENAPYPPGLKDCLDRCQTLVQDVGGKITAARHKTGIL